MAIGLPAASPSEASDGSTAGGQCGDEGITLVLRNPDLQVQEDGLIHASGWFFIQFQAVGPNADRVSHITFSFGKANPTDQNSCEGPVWFTGEYLMNYRGDYNAEDGFFVPINTTLVPDGDYGAAIHAYDSGGTEIKRFWVEAVVDNDAGDKVIPWPKILPGDGQQQSDASGVTIEFAEALSGIEAFIDGEPIALEPWEGRAYDDDAIPSNEPGGPAEGLCATGQCNQRVWGPAYQYTGPVEDDDIIKVVARDAAGNVATKIVHLLDPTAGGIVTTEQVRFDMQVAQDTVEAPSGGTANFDFTFTNIGQTEAHVDLLWDNQGPLTPRWEPDHVVVPGGERVNAALHVSVPGNVTSGTFPITAVGGYESGTGPAQVEVPVTVVVGEGGPVGNQTGNETEETGDALSDSGGGSPATGLIMAAAAAALVVLARRRGDRDA